MLTHHRITPFAVLVAVAAVAGSARLDAQATTGSIGGRVLGPNGEPLDAVQVQVTNTATGISTGTQTRSDGRYIVLGLEVGSRYRVIARRIGYAPFTVQPLTVSLGQETPVNVQLRSQATVLQTQVVSASATATTALISPSQRGAQTLITDTLIRKLPTLNRNFTDFVQLTPQVSTNGPGLSGGGVNNRFNNIQIDGATEKDLFGLGSTGQPGGQANGKSIGIESVKEYQVLLAPYDVRLGNFAGLTVNAVTKSGTNEVTGSLYTYGRNQNFQRSQPYITDYKQLQYGLSIGGPIVRDKAFFFVNPEFQSESRPAAGAYLGSAGSAVTQGLLDQFTSTLTQRGFTDLGSAGLVQVKNPLSNVFARVDVVLPFNSTLIVRENYAHAELDNFSRATGGTAPSFPLSSTLYHFTSDKNAPVAQLRTNFASGAFNEAILGYTRIRDTRSTPGTLQPQVTVIQSGVATLVAGTDGPSQANALDQDIFEVTDNLTLPLGSSHRLTLGTQNQFYKVRNLFGNNYAGAYTFGSLDSLALNKPRQYQVGVPVTGDGAVRFHAQQLSAYVQDDWTLNERFNVSLGVRADIPRFTDKPPYNAQADSQFTAAGYGSLRTDQIPSSNVQFSPRFGFNWNTTGDGRNQVRGGVGVFESSPAYVWLSNSFQNSGGVSGFASLNCSTPQTAPALTTTSLADRPTTCTDGTQARAGAEIDLLDPNLKFPQTLRGNLAYDRAIGDGFVASVEGLYTRALNSFFYYNYALADAPIGYGIDGRALYGTAAGSPVLKVKGRNAVYRIINASKDYSYSFTPKIEKRFTRNFGGALSYTFSQAYDVQSLTSSTAGSQYRFGRVYAGDQKSLDLTHSAFEAPHRIVANGSYTFPKTGTSLSAIYTGQSGLRFAYVSSTDLNGDGQTLNDPIYVPNGYNDPKGPVFQQFVRTITVNGVSRPDTVSPSRQQAAFYNFVQNSDCLRNAQGTILTRNACQAPWTNEIDVSIEQPVRTFRGQNFSVHLDAINFGNLLNRNWGRQITGGNFNPQTLYTSTGTVLPGSNGADPNATKGATLTNGVPRVNFTPDLQPFNYDNVYSNYTLQLSVRYTF